jgi:hypothetical protein
MVRTARINRADGCEVFHSIKHLYPLELSVLQPGARPHTLDIEIVSVMEKEEIEDI